MNDVAVSVVLPVHAGADPHAFRLALASVLAQDRPADEVLVVEDGPLLPAHHAVVGDLAVGATTELRRVVLPENRGAGVANQAGLVAARGEWVVKADADDICLPQRIRVQLAALEATGADVCGAAMGEFADDPRQTVSVRSNPAEHAAIGRRMRFNNPINHPTAVYRRAAALEAGGYPTLRYMQDYDLFARMYAAGATMVNLPEVLVLFRADRGMVSRRRSTAMRECEAALQRNLQEYGLIGPVRRRANYAARQAVRAMPSPVLQLAYAATVRGSGSRALPGVTR